ncbi:Cellulase (glycosyl hydrolase family 5) protein [Striga hermonthica]|uniref:Cellulase (Glycosyl hydrolase family 5) protein n=1 Tax=Striga hermonthica TaxID=68872 RepID=A0A9N7MPG9_STRHE|nr:Cellulase (glycosyl hydrolase family 5) protein [Striga hermonthica]
MEKKMGGITAEVIILVIFLEILSFSNSAPLSTSSRWIVDRATGGRVKLACANWVSHLQPMIAEGLEKKPLAQIARQIAGNGFNCVRFTWATYAFTRPDYYGLTVSQSLNKYNLTAAKAGIEGNNPWAMGLKVVELHQAVVNELGKNNLMVVLDNHVSLPGWCCGSDDGNGFFGDPNFDPNEWLQGLAAVARTYKGNQAVVGMSMRNELRGSRQNEADWYKYMQAGANTIHTENPDFLVIVSGLSFDTNLGFLKNKPIDVKFNDKLVFEAHWYTFGIPDDQWTTQTNSLCARVTKTARDNHLFLTSGDNPFPLFLSEFGIDQRGQKEAENRYISCLLAEVAEKDLDWALWTFQGSYILREGKRNLEEVYGIMDLNWDRPRNPGFVDRLQIMRQMNQDPNSKKPTKYVIFHPQSGQCVQIGKDSNNLLLANCKSADRWDQHRDGGPIKLAGKSRWLAAEGDGGAASLSNNCSTSWKLVSSSGLHLAAEIGGGNYVCLEKKDSGPTVVTNKCLCVGDDLADLPTCNDNPQSIVFRWPILEALEASSFRPKNHIAAQNDRGATEAWVEFSKPPALRRRSISDHRTQPTSGKSNLLSLLMLQRVLHHGPSRDLLSRAVVLPHHYIYCRKSFLKSNHFQVATAADSHLQASSVLRGNANKRERMVKSEIIARAEELVKSAMGGNDASHDAAHAFRVRDLALSLAREEGFSTSPDSILTVELAALLHDIGDYKYMRDPSEGQIVEDFLVKEGVNETIRSRILGIIKRMGFKEEAAGVTWSTQYPELGVVQDADRLDAIGAIGIARCFTFGGSRNSMLYDPNIKPRSDLSKEKYMSKEEQTTVNHFHEKLLKLKELMKTKAGQKRAERRHKFMEGFLEEFYQEWDGRA